MVMQWISPAQERSGWWRRPPDGVARARRPVVRLGAVAVLSLAAVGLGVVGGRPAAAPAAAAPAAAEAAATTDPVVTGIVQREEISDFDSTSSTSVGVACPPGKQILGGGAHLYSRFQPDRLALTRLQPYGPGTDAENPYGYGFRASAVETDSSVTSDWYIWAHAYCADPVAGLHIVPRTTDWSAASVLATDAVCPSGERALGTGARIITPLPGGDPEGGLGLQVARVDALGGLARAQARIVPSGYAHWAWRLAAYAVCAPRPSGYEVRTASSVEGGPYSTATSKWVPVDCPESVWFPPAGQTVDKLAVSVGAAVDNTAPGNVTLYSATPFDDMAKATENPATAVGWTLVARANSLPKR
jgi:hypothetical protein